MNSYHKTTLEKYSKNTRKIKEGMKMKYSKEFKEQAIKLSDEIGIKQACAQLGLVYGTLSD